MPLMKREIQIHGAYFEQDAVGFLINTSSIDSLKEEWKVLLNYLVKQVKNHFGTQLHSLYLRGSLASGNPVNGLSDVDLFAMVHSKEKRRWESVEAAKEWASYCAKHFSVFHDLDFRISSYSPHWAVENPSLAFVMQTQSLCLYGDDLRDRIPPYKITDVPLLALKWLRADLDDLYKKKEWSAADCREICKLLLRAAFDLVMEKDGRYTNSLYFCWRSFSHYYPEKEKVFKALLSDYLNPDAVGTDFKERLKTAGEWLYAEACREKKIEADL